MTGLSFEINPISGTTWWSKKPKLGMVISFKQEGTGEKQTIYTLRYYATVQGETFNIGPLLTFSEWTAYFDGTHESSDALHYYVNINDDLLVQGNDLEFTLQLWVINAGKTLSGTRFDVRQILGTDIYTINSPGHSEILNVTTIGSFQLEQDVRINVTTIGIEKANTIAIYETNGTVFNGHYQEQERMNIIQLYVNDSGAGTPFKEGPNVIVIPTSLFTETVFNAHVQNETLDETPIYNADDEIFKFISVGRDGDTEQACDEIDFVFIRFEISSEDAKKILNLLLECLVNETNNKTAIVYSYVSTKLNGTLAVMMNLPISVLGFIPWFCEKESSPFGKKPKTKKQALWEPLKKLASFAVGLIITIGMAILELIELIAEFVMEILMEWLPILGYILWLIIRVLMLIFIWIIFAITLLIIIIQFVLLVGAVYAFNIFMDLQINTKINKITVQGETNFIFGYEIGNEYNNFFDIYYPTIDTYLESDHFELLFKIGFFSIDINITDYTDNILDEFFDKNPEQSSNSNLKSNDLAYSADSEDFYVYDFLSNIGDGLAQSSAFYILVSFIAKLSPYDPKPSYDLLVGLGYFVVELVFWILTTSVMEIFIENDIMAFACALFGLAVGHIFSALVAFTSFLYLWGILNGGWSASSPKQIIIAFLNCLDKCLYWFGIEWSLVELSEYELTEGDLVADSVMSIIGGGLGLVIGVLSLITIMPLNKGVLYTGICSFISLLFGFILACIALDLKKQYS